MKTQTLKSTLHDSQADLVRRAAAKSHKTLSEYIADVVVPWAASELNEAVPVLPKLGRKWQAQLIAEAAEKAGLSVEDFRDQAITDAAMHALGYKSEPPPAMSAAPPAHESGLRPRVANGRG
jgi:uncharacterized protein (DUF1778 family)